MRTLITTLYVLILACSDISDKTKLVKGDYSFLSDTSQAIKILSKTNNLISKCDTIVSDKNYTSHIISCYDKDGNVLKTEKANLYQSDSRLLFHYSELYDSLGQVIYSDTVVNFNIVQYTLYKYDNKKLTAITNHKFNDTAEVIKYFSGSDSSFEIKSRKRPVLKPTY